MTGATPSTCHEILKHILGEPTDEATSSNLSPPTAEWLKIDFIFLSWIFMTLSETLQQRLVVEDPQTAKEAWDLIALIFNYNKRTALKAELRSLKLRDLSIDAYFCNLKCEYPSVSDGDGYSIPVIDSGHSTLPAPHQPLHLNNVLITPNIVKNLIYVRQFVRDNHCTAEFDAFDFSVKDFITHWMLLRCDSTGDLYLITKPSTIRHAFITSQYT
ncbi:hypothetical protein Tco_1124828 [Tanacetum coccineum]|uniref:Retrotransposon gag domain-containing protein n=1 Tax=Tanacetum coccineum TaxID=301880 RepID=A0ABQ5JA46_9ASTR